MEKYDVISVVGEGSYGLVMRCRHRESGQYVAIKKFLETEDDPTVRKMALREIRMLKKLRHENLVNMLEVFRRKKRFFLVFEYLEHTVLEQLEQRVGGLGFTTARKYCYQVLRALDFIHSHDVIHRDIKPENVLVSRLGIIKLCDFGFARPYTENETFTDYVATRWYRSPELLVGDPRYGKEVDIWAVGCLYAEMMTGEPLFPGESDIDQLFQIIRVVGKLNARHQLLVTRNAMFKGMRQEQNTSLHQMFPDWTHDSLDFLQQCLKMDGQQQRPATGRLLLHDLFTADQFADTFLVEMRAKLRQEMQGTPLLKRMPSYGSGRKGQPLAADTKKSGDAVSKSKAEDYRFAPSKGGGASQIGLSLNTGTIGSSGQTNSSAQQQRRVSGDEVGLNLAALRQYLHQHQKPTQKQMININNLIFRDNHQAATPHSRSRIVSAKATKNSDADSKLSSTGGVGGDAHGQQQQPPSSSPVHFQSLQPDIGGSLHHGTASDLLLPPSQSKRLSPVSVSNLSVNGTSAAALASAASAAPPPQYFSHRRSSNILGLQQVAAQKQQHQQHQQQQQQQKHTPNNAGVHHHGSHAHQMPKKRERLIDVALMPLGGGSNAALGDGAKEQLMISPRLLPPPWLTGNLKITTQQEGKSVHQIGKRGMTDWKSTAGVGQSMTNPETGGLFGDLLLPTCPGATGVSPYKPNRLNNNNNNNGNNNSKVKLSPIANAPAAAADAHEIFSDSSEGRK